MKSIAQFLQVRNGVKPGRNGRRSFSLRRERSRGKKGIRGVRALLLALVLSAGAVAGGRGASCDGCTRVGVSFGGVHMVGVFVEQRTGETAVRAQVGYMIHAVSLNLTVMRYFESGEVVPYVGFGLMRHLRDMNLEGESLLCMPLGTDFELSGRQHLGAELIPAVDRILEYVFPLPSLSYKYTLE